MKNIELFGRKIPVSVLIWVIILAAAGVGIMTSRFTKGPLTYFASDTASIVQFPNRNEIPITIGAEVSSE